MKISALRLFNVRRFANRGVAIEGIGDGVNVLCAANEFGKSTSFEALHALFFQPHSGTPGDVQRLRPYSGGSPIIEADITTDEGRFRITKQYYGGRSARVLALNTGTLVAQADEAENLIAGLIRGGSVGPAGLLWVRQGVTGIEKRSKAEEDGEKQARTSLLESVQGEVEAVTGGRRMAEIMAKTAEALSELVTSSGKPKAGGRYALAIEKRDGLAALEQKLFAEVSALRSALDQRTVAAQRLSEIDDAEERQERRKAVATAQAAFDLAKAQGETLKTAEAELKLAGERRNTAQRDAETFQGARETAVRLRSELDAARRQRDAALTRRREAADAIASATAEEDAAEQMEKEARDLLARLDAVLRAREASERLSELQTRLGQAEAAREAVEKADAALALLKIPPAAIEELQLLEIEIAKLRAVEEAARPSVAISYEADAAGSVTMDGVSLKEGMDHGYDAQARLSVPGIGTITLRSNRPPRSDGDLRQAEGKRRTLLESTGVDDLAAARDRQVRAQRVEEDRRECKAKLSLLAPDGLPKLREEVAAYAAIDPEALELTHDPAEARSALAAAEERRKNSRQSFREAEPLRASADNAFISAETTFATLTAELSKAEAILGEASARDERERFLSSSLDELERQLVAFDERATKLREVTPHLDLVQATLDRAQSVETGAEKEIATLRENIAGWNAEIRTRADDAVEESWRETVDAHSAASARVKAFDREVAVLQRLSSALESARSDARELYLKPVMKELQPLLGLLFDDVSITFDEKTLQPHKIQRNGQEEEVDRLSGGMREQLSVLTRLAFARLLARDGRPAPVILDDALAYSDDDRIEKMFDALHRQSREQQIIVFSCRQRAFQKLGGNILSLTEWRP